jgi:hypothetical protein
LANINQANIIVKETDIFQNDKIEFVKKVLASINKKFKVDNILGIEEISFNFDFEIPQTDTFKFPYDITMYTPSKDANLLEAVNNIIWLYLFHKEDFNEKLKQFDHFVQIAEAHKEFVFLYPAYHEIHIELLNEIISKGNCKENNFEDFQALFYSQYGIDLKEYLDKKPIYEEAIFDESTDKEPTNNKRSPETIYKENHINSNKNKILANITHLDEFNPENRKITFNITPSQPIHKFIKSYSSYIEINPLLSKEELHALINQYHQTYNELKEMLTHFDVKVVLPKDDKIYYKTNPTYDMKSDAPADLGGIQVLQKSMLILMIMEHYQIDNFGTAVRYYNYYLMKENYQSIQFEDNSLFDFLDSDEYDGIDGTISLKKQNNFNPIKSGAPKQLVMKLLKLLKKSL